MVRHWTIVTFTLFLAMSLLAGAARADWEVGQAVEVQRGTEWVPATVTRKINGNYQVRYEQGGLVVVSPGRVRAAEGGKEGSAGASDGATSGGGAAAESAPSRPAPAWRLRQKVEVKTGMSWHGATIIRRQGDWWLVQHDRGDMGEWVEPWRIREAGSEEDNIGVASPNRRFREGRRVYHAPKDAPGEPPPPFGSRSTRAAVPRARIDPGTTTRKAPPRAVASVTVPELEAVRDGWRAAPRFANLASTTAIPLDPAVVEASAGSVTGVGQSMAKLKDIVAAHGAPIIVLSTDASSEFILHRIDIAAGRLLDSVALGRGLKLASVNADGTRALLLPEQRHDDQRLQVWQLGDAPAEIATLVVGLNARGEAGAPAWCAFAPGGGVVTLDEKGHLGLWDLESRQLTHQFKFEARLQPGLSPGGRLLAGVAGSEIVVLDLQEKVICGRFTVRGHFSGQLVFSPDGSRVFMPGAGVVRGWDVATGEEVGKGGPMRGRSASFGALDANHILVGDAHIVDVQRGMRILDYMYTHGIVAVGPQGMLLHAERDMRADEMRVGWAMQPLEEASQRAAAWNPREHVLIPAGARVAATVEGVFDVGNAAEATAGLVRTLTRVGYVIDPSSTIRFKGVAKKGETRKEQWQDFIRRGPVYDVTITPTQYLITAEVAGEVVWRTGGFRDARQVTDKGDGRVQEKIDEMTRSEASYFGSTTIPGEIIAEYVTDKGTLP